MYALSGDHHHRCAKLFVGCLYLITSAALTIVEKKTFSFQGFNQVLLLASFRQLCILTSTLTLQLCGIINLQRSQLPSKTFGAVVISFVSYVVSSLYGLKCVSIPLYTTLLKINIVFTVAIEYFWKGSRLRHSALVGVLLIVLGALFTGWYDLENSSLLDYAVCLFCNICTSFYLVSVSEHKERTEVSGVDVVYQTSLYALPIFCSLSFLAGDLPAFRHVIQSGGSDFLSYFVCSSLLAGALNVVTVYNVRLNSAVGQNVLANFKDILVVLASIGIGQSIVDLPLAFSIGLGLFGGCLFSCSDHTSWNIIPARNTFASTLKQRRPQKRQVMMCCGLCVGVVAMSSWLQRSMIVYTFTSEKSNTSSTTEIVTHNHHQEPFWKEMRFSSRRRILFPACERTVKVQEVCPNDVEFQIEHVDNKYKCVRDVGQKTVNFFATATGRQLDFIVLYAFFALSSNKNAFVEMVVEQPKSFVDANRRGLDWLFRRFGEHSMCVRGFHPSTVSRTRVPNTWRYLETPVVYANYTYIGDVDILITEDVVKPKRLAQMKYFLLPYSNIIRPNTTRLTGVMLVSTKEFYSEEMVKAQKEEDASGNDEHFLYRLVQRSGFGLPGVANSTDAFTTYRPLHGLHVSLNRGIGKRLCQTTWIEQEATFCKVIVTPQLDDFLCQTKAGRSMFRNYFDTALAQIILQGKTHCSEELGCVCVGQRRVALNGISYDIVRPNVSFPNFLFTVYSSGDIVSNNIKRTGVWDGAISNIMLNVLRFRNTTSTIIDFGANIGWFSAIAAADGHNSMAIEAMESNRLALELSLELNGLSQRVQILPYALGSDASPKSICIAPRSSGNAGNGMLQNVVEDICPELTPVKTLDDIIYLDENFHTVKHIDFMKADCGGCEARAILGARRLFKQNPPCSVFAEWRPDTMRQVGATDDPASAARILSQAGYFFFSVHATLDTGHNISVREIPQERVESTLLSNTDVLLLHKKCFSAEDVKLLLVECGRTAEKLNTLSRSESYVW